MHKIKPKEIGKCMNNGSELLTIGWIGETSIPFTSASGCFSATSITQDPVPVPTSSMRCILIQIKRASRSQTEYVRVDFLSALHKVLP